MERNENHSALRPDRHIKVVLLGAAQSGKTKLALQIVATKGYQQRVSTWTEFYEPTMLQNEALTDCQNLKNPTRLGLCECGGNPLISGRQGEFMFHVTDVFLVCFSKADERSFSQFIKETSPWTEKAQSSRILVGTKSDLPHAVSTAVAEAKAKENGMLYCECSAKSASGLQQLYELILSEAHAAHHRRTLHPPVASVPTKKADSSSSQARQALLLLREALTAYCDDCRGAISFGALRHHCFADQCKETNSFDLCHDCATKKDEPHEHRMWAETLYPANDLSWMLSGETVALTFTFVFTHYASRPCLGYRTKPSHLTLGDFNWLTYGDVYSRSRKIASSLSGLVSRVDSVVAIAGPNIVDHFLVDFACMWAGVISAPLPYSMTNKDLLLSALTTARPEVLILSQDLLPMITDIEGSCKSLQHVLVMGEKHHHHLPSHQSIKFHWLRDIEHAGDSSALPIPKCGPLDPFTLQFTSGSTGKAKALALTNAAWNQSLDGGAHQLVQPCSLSFAPLSHSQRLNDWKLIRFGGRVGLFEGRDVGKSLFEDLASVRPTTLTAVPRVWDVFYDRFQEELLHYRAKHPDVTPADARNTMITSFRVICGGRLSQVTTGGAATRPEVLQWLRECFPLVQNVYGSMETGAIAADGDAADSAELRLESVPEMGYLVTDKPYARGEVLVRSSTGAAGYWNDPEATKEAWKDGWFHTGDIGMILENGELVLIDRRKNFFKLSQGVWVAPTALEEIFLESSLIDQVWVCGSSDKAFLVALVVPKLSLVRQRMKLLQMEKAESLSDAELVQTAEVNELVLRELTTIALKHKRPRYEVPRGVLLSIERLSEANALMTSSGKLCRFELQKRFRGQIASLYEHIEANLQKQAKEVRDTVQKLIAKALPAGSGGEVLSSGLDSMSAVSLSAALESHFPHLRVSAQTLLDERLSTSRLADLIEEAVRTNSSELSMATQLPQVPLEDYHLDAKHSVDVNTEKYVKSSSPTILLTGATGFLGVFLLRDLLTLTSAQKVYCIVRSASDATAAMVRIRGSFERFRKLWPPQHIERVECLVGDISAPRFALTESQWTALSQQVTDIWHNAAHVNAVLPYSRLRAVNVRSTAEIIRFATTTRIKRVNYVSTISILNATPLYNETSELSMDLTKIPSVGGYSLSKWCSEKLLREAAARFGMPLTVLRPGTISGDTASGSVNAECFLNRYLYAILQLHAYPNEEALMDMIPVNYVSRAAVLLCDRAPDSVGRTYHLLGYDAALTVRDVGRLLRDALAPEYPMENTTAYRQHLFVSHSRSLIGLPGFQELNFEEWLDRLRVASTSDESLRQLLPFVSHGFPSGLPFNRDRSLEALVSCDIEPPPTIDAALLQRYASFSLKNK